MDAFLVRTRARLHAMALSAPAPAPGRRGEASGGQGGQGGQGGSGGQRGSSASRLGPVGRSILTVGALAALAGVVVIWAARASVHHPVYVSELGAQRMPTATAFAVALLLIAAGGAVIAVLGRHPRVGRPLLMAWPIGATIGVSSVCFAVASQVTCTATCPVPVVNPASTPQDLIHITAAVLGFAAGCVAMVQVAVAHGDRIVARASLAAGVLVGVITIVGGVLAILRRAVDVGALLEFSATTVAVTWLAGYGLWLAHRRLPASPRSGPPRAE